MASSTADSNTNVPNGGLPLKPSLSPPPTVSKGVAFGSSAGSTVTGSGSGQQTAGSSTGASGSSKPAVSFRVNPVRIRQQITRLPFFTRCVLVVAIVAWVLSIAFPWLPQWAALRPAGFSLKSGYQFNTFAIVHRNFFHMVFGLLITLPLLSRFEGEVGTMITLLLFTGLFSTVPSVIFIFVERLLLPGHSGIAPTETDPYPTNGITIQGLTPWAFVLLGTEASRTARVNPFFRLTSTTLPTYPWPLVAALALSVLAPRALLPAPMSPLVSSFIAHSLCVLMGYAFGPACPQSQATGSSVNVAPSTSMGTPSSASGVSHLMLYTIPKYVRKILVPPEKYLRWIETKLNLLGRLPHFVTVDQTRFGRYGILPTASNDRLGRR